MSIISTNMLMLSTVIRNNTQRINNANNIRRRQNQKINNKKQKNNSKIQEVNYEK